MTIKPVTTNVRWRALNCMTMKTTRGKLTRCRRSRNCIAPGAIEGVTSGRNPKKGCAHSGLSPCRLVG
jgi:hypothetical protein